MRLFIINVTPFWKISDPLHTPWPLPPGFTPLCTSHCALTKCIHKKPSPSLPYRNLWMVPSCWTSLLKDIGLQSSLLLHVYCQFLLLSLLFKSISAIVHVRHARESCFQSELQNAQPLLFQFYNCHSAKNFSCHPWNILIFVYCNKKLPQIIMLKNVQFSYPPYIYHL